MTEASLSYDVKARATWGVGPLILQPTTARLLLLAVVIVSIVCGTMSGSPDAAVSAGSDLTRLLRFMAMLKAALAAIALAALFWRLATAVSPVRFTAYVISSSAMTAGPGLIWGMDHVALGSLLLHSGLAGLVVLLWRDHAVADRLSELVRSKKNVRKGRSSPTARNG